ncbi:MAG: hypothetical protein IPM29_10195 [Planctomycetes bacterium]|nr:hypothetical protein [Planctomycetota bacterium]
MIVRVVCLLLLLVAPSAAQLGWVLRNPANLPSVRSGHGLAYDVQRGHTVCYGGAWLSQPYRETWLWDGSDWSLVPTTQSPLAVVDSAMAYDVSRGRFVLYGGRSTNGSLTETWEFDGLDWTERFPQHVPPGAVPYAMVWCGPLRGMFMFRISPHQNDSWAFDGSDWNMLSPQTSPPPRESAAMAYDVARERVVLFGGRGYTSTATIELDDHWEFDGANWTQIHTATVPTARFGACMAYDAHRQRIVMHGGILPLGHPIEQNTVWDYDGIDWQRRTVAGLPRVGTQSRMVYDTQRRRMVTFGLYTSSSVATWELYATRPAAYGRFAVGCANNPRATLAPFPLSFPWQGDAFLLQIAGPPGSDRAWLLTGLSNRSFGPAPLPFDLGPLGIPGCDLLVSPDVIGGVPLVGQMAHITILIPTDPRLVGRLFYQQAVVADPLAAPLPLTVTDAFVGLIGSR